MSALRLLQIMSLGREASSPDLSKRIQMPWEEKSMAFFSWEGILAFVEHDNF
jgi:hypothetical protein